MFGNKKDMAGEFTYCQLHNNKVIQLGYSITCNCKCPICDFKGCIKTHEGIHNVMTIETIRNIVNEYVDKDMSKRSYLKKLISDYFVEVKKQIQNLFQQIFQSINNFKFESIILREEEELIVQKLIEEKYNQITCAEIATIIPKLQKCAHYEDGHFLHLRDYVAMEKENVGRILNSSLLNIPYFREFQVRKKKIDQGYVTEIADENLKDVNEKLRNITKKLKKLRIKYSKKCLMDQLMMAMMSLRREFIRLLCQLPLLSDLESVEVMCTWDVRDEDFQVAFFEALTKFPYLKDVTITTGYKVTDAQYINEVVDEIIEVKVYLKEWAF